MKSEEYDDVKGVELDALYDLADEVSRAAWSKLANHDAVAALVVIGTLMASVEQQLGWSRERVLSVVQDVADDCNTIEALHDRRRRR